MMMMVVVGVERVLESAMSLLVMEEEEEEEGTIRIVITNMVVAVAVAVAVAAVAISNVKLVPTPRHIYQSAITTKSIPMPSLTNNFKIYPSLRHPMKIHAEMIQ